jgi:hypothetical protein
MSDYPRRPDPAELILPLWKAERWLSEQDGDDRAYTILMAAANVRRAPSHTLEETVANTNHDDLRSLALAELQERRSPTEDTSAVSIPRRLDAAYRAELERIRAARTTPVDPAWSWEDVRTLLGVAGRLEPSLADWLEEIALRVADQL